MENTELGMVAHTTPIILATHKTEIAFQDHPGQNVNVTYLKE
jgi:hypothetical protein